MVTFRSFYLLKNQVSSEHNHIYKGHSLTQKFITLLCTLTLLASTLSAAPFAKVIFSDGEPHVIRKLKKIKLSKGDIVHYKDQIVTSSKDKVTLESDDGHRIYVLEGTKFKVPTPKKKDVVINHEIGHIWFKMNPLKKEESFNVVTPSAVAGVRGTKFITMVFGDKTTDLCVCEGEVLFRSGDTEKVVTTGQGSLSSLSKGMGSTFSNQSFIRQKRRLSRKPVCVNCHGDGYQDSSNLDGENLILK